MSDNIVKNVVIAGGGTAGWMVASALSSLLGSDLNITLIESDDIQSVGVGEATIPPILNFLKLLKIDEADFMRATNATFKLGINFQDWKSGDDAYFHSFGTTGKDCWAATFHNFWLKGLECGYNARFDEYCLEAQAANANKFARLKNGGLKYAYHLDATLFAAYLRKMSEGRGVNRVEGKITDVTLCSDNGCIKSLKLASGTEVQGDLFIDCSGFKGILIERALHVGYEDWSHWLPCDRAIAVQTNHDEEMSPFTRAIAHECGWRWKIPLQNRVGNGLVYCQKYLSDEAAEIKLLKELDGQVTTKPKVIRFQPGRRLKSWHKNCVAIGLSSGFLEPLESTSIHLIQRSIVRLMQLFPSYGFKQPDVDEFNRQANSETEYIRDFIILHYKVTKRSDSAFWRYCKTMDVPATLERRIDLFRQCGRIFREDVDLFTENSWVQVMLGQGITPRQYHPIANEMSSTEMDMFLSGIRSSVERTLQNIPSHGDYLHSYCSKGS